VKIDRQFDAVQLEGQLVSFSIITVTDENTKYDGDIPIEGFTRYLDITLNAGKNASTIHCPIYSGPLMDLAQTLLEQAIKLKLMERETDKAVERNLHSNLAKQAEEIKNV